MRRAHMTTSLLAAALVCAGLGACSGDEADGPTPSPTGEASVDATATPIPPTATPSPEPTEAAPAVRTLIITGTVPSDGAMAIPRFPSVQVTFSDPLPAGAAASISARVVSGEVSIPLFVDTDTDEEGDASVAFLPTVPLDADADYALEVDVEALEGPGGEAVSGPLSWRSAFSTRVPCGVAFDIAKDIHINALGGNDRLVRVLQETLDKTGLAPIALQLVDVFTPQTFPVSDVRLVAGLPRLSGGLYVPDPAYGFPVSVNGCTIEADAARGCDGDRGWMSCDESTFVFPIPITDTTIIYLVISHAQLSACASQSGSFTDLTDFTVEGVITQEDLLAALEAAGVEGVADYVVLDADVDGDGVLDAAHASASSDPAWMDFKDCDETGN